MALLGCIPSAVPGTSYSRDPLSSSESDVQAPVRVVLREEVCARPAVWSVCGWCEEMS